MTLLPLGDSAVVITFGEGVDTSVVNRVRALAAAIAREAPAGVVDIVPAFASIAVYFDPANVASFDEFCRKLEELAAGADALATLPDSRTVEITVAYGGEDGPDLNEVAAHAGLTPSEVVARHAQSEYQVYAIGFVPGFPYLGGLPPELATPRRATPRPRVKAGSVGIGGAQTGIYPLETPGGWNLIGRTSLALFDPARAEPALLRAGDRVKFRALASGETPVGPVKNTGEASPQTRDQRPETKDPNLTCSQRLSDFKESSGRNDTLPPGAATETDLRSLRVVRAGMFTTVQDLGRRGHRAAGVPVSGAADSFAFRLANLLVGNAENTAALEFTLVGPHLRFTTDAVVALTGADFGGPALWRPFRVKAGTELKLGAARGGCRGYLAIAGGVRVPVVLGSSSTYVRAALGGFEGRTLRDGDSVPVAPEPRVLRNHWRIDERILPLYSSAPRVRVMPAANLGECFERLCRFGNYRVTRHADRMGVRVAGAPVTLRRSENSLSSPVAPGTVQVPPDGQPIILLADAQTIGGYPQIGHVASVDLALVAQLRPGDAIDFVAATVAEARVAGAEREHALSLLRQGLAQKLA